MGLAGRPVGRVQTLMILFVLGLCLLIFREMRIASPIINFRVLKERNLAVSCIIMFCAFGVLYAASIALPGMLQRLFGYDALRSGLVMSPSGVSSLAAMVIVGVLVGRGLDARWPIAAGLVAMAAGNYWMARMNLQISPGQVVGPRMLLTLGLGLLFAPMSVAAYKYTPVHLRGAAVGLLASAHRGGQRRHVDGPDDSRAARAVSPVPAGRRPEPAEPPRPGVPGWGSDGPSAANG